MSKNAYHEMFVHVVWHTKESRGYIEPAMETVLYDTIRRRALEPGGVYVHQIGGTVNHIHLVARIRPTLLVSEWIGKIKGGSAHDINQTDRWHRSLQWQEGYGLVTFGMNDLPWVVDYVQKQKEHHHKGEVFDRLERIGPADETAG